MTTLKTIGSEVSNIDIDKDDDGWIYLNQDVDCIVLSPKAVQELGLFLTNLDLD